MDFKKKVFLLCILWFFMLFIWQRYQLNWFTRGSIFGHFSLKHSISGEHSSQTTVDSISQLDRLMQLNKTCNKLEPLLKQQHGYNKKVVPFFVSQRYNLSYCKIGKIASTFWTQVFYVLHHDGASTEKLLTTTRQFIHSQESDAFIQGWFKKSKHFGTRMIITTRNPYTRLFSAYIDRIFIASSDHLLKNPTYTKCKSQVSFSDFLKQIVENTRQGIFNFHWSPEFILCKPCELKPYFVFKQESFTEDFNYLMSLTYLESYKRNIIRDTMHAQANWTAFTVIEDALNFVAKDNLKNTLDCQTWKQVTVRLWNGMKIQGLVPENTPFPIERYKHYEDFKNSSILQKAVIDARSSHPMTKTDVSAQRRRALNRYYRTVHPEIIAGIKEVFRPDFEIFGYSDNAPPW